MTSKSMSPIDTLLSWTWTKTLVLKTEWETMTIYWDVHLQKRVLALGEGNYWRRAQLKVVTALAPSSCWNECHKPG